jgi:hypothetical protein
MHRPRCLRRALHPRVDTDAPSPGAVRRTDGHLNLNTALLRQHQRRLERQLLQHRTTDLITRTQRQLHQPGTRQQHTPQHLMIRQPVKVADREPSGQQDAVRLRRDHQRTEQRVVHDLEADSPHIAGPRRGVRPVALALEGVRGQVDAAGTRPVVERRPVDRIPRDVETAQRGQKRRDLAVVAPQRGHECHGIFVGDGLLPHSGEYRIRTQLQERGDARLFQVPHTIAEADCFAHVPHPVVRGRQVLGDGDRAGDIRDHRNLRGPEGQLLQNRPELAQHRLHQRRVKGVRHPQPRRTPTLRLKTRGNSGNRLRLARHHHGTQPVDRRDTDETGEIRGDLVLGRLNSHHRPTRVHRFARSEPRESALAYMQGLISPLDLLLHRLLPSKSHPRRAGPRRGQPLGRGGMLPDRQAGMRPGRLPGPPLSRLAPTHHPGHGRPRLPHRPAGPRVRYWESRNGSSQLTPLTLPELRRLITRLTNRRLPPIEHVLQWSYWRRRRQHQARVSHYKQRGHTPPETAQPSGQTPLQY